MVECVGKGSPQVKEPTGKSGGDHAVLWGGWAGFGAQKDYSPQAPDPSSGLSWDNTAVWTDLVYQEPKCMC